MFLFKLPLLSSFLSPFSRWRTHIFTLISHPRVGRYVLCFQSISPFPALSQILIHSFAFSSGLLSKSHSPTTTSSDIASISLLFFPSVQSSISPQTLLATFDLPLNYFRSTRSMSTSRLYPLSPVQEDEGHSHAACPMWRTAWAKQLSIYTWYPFLSCLVSHSHKPILVPAHLGALQSSGLKGHHQSLITTFMSRPTPKQRSFLILFSHTRNPNRNSNLSSQRSGIFVYG